MKQIFILLSCLLIFTANILYAQAPAIEWQKCLGGGGGDYAHAIEPTNDGGYIVAGYTASSEGDVTGNHNNNGLNDFWVVKLSSTGSIQWQKTLGGRSEDRASAIHQTPDGGYVVSGHASSNDGDVTGNHRGMDYWIVKLNSTGDIEWQKSMGGEKNEYNYSMQLTPDGGYILAGCTESASGDVTSNHGNRDYWVVKVTGTGNIQWQKSLGGSGDDEAFSVQVTTDGGYVVAGYTESNDGDVSGFHGKRDYWIVKLTKAGTIAWQKCLGGSLFEEAWSVQQTRDGGYIVAGYSGSNDNDVSGNHQSLGGFSDYWIVKLSSTGNIQWQKCLGGKYNEHAYAIQLTPDGGYIVAGSAESSDGDVSCNEGLTDYWVAKLSSTGSIQWQKSMGGGYYDEAYAVMPTKDGGCIVAGVTCSQNVNGYHPALSSTCGDFWIMKLSGTVVNSPKTEVNITASSTIVCSGTTVTFTATPINSGVNLSFQWQLNGIEAGTNSPVYSNSTFKDGDVIRCVMINNGGCLSGTTTVISNSITLQVKNSPPPEVTVVASETTICAGTEVTFTATNKSKSADPSYHWLVDGKEVGTNSTVYATNTLTNGAVVQCRMTVPQCIGTTKDYSDPITVIVNPTLNPSITITANAATICKGSSVTFTAMAVQSGAHPTYQWKVNGTNAGSNSTTFTSTTLMDGDEINCELIADPFAKCTITSSAVSNNIIVKVSEVVTSSLSITSSSNIICSGIPVTFKASPSNAGASPHFEWKVNGNPAGTSNDTFIANTLINGDAISCIMTGNTTCSAPVSSNNIIMTVHPSPVINFTTDTVLLQGGSVQLNPSITGAIAHYEWTPASGLNNSALLNPIASPASTTTYQLSVLSIDGCKASGKVTALQYKNLGIPNAFTPNGDGKNDVFRIPPGVLFTLNFLCIYDRWGGLVFKTTDINKGWDGTCKGALVAQGVYIYTIKGISQNKEVSISGTLMLLR